MKHMTLMLLALVMLTACGKAASHKSATGSSSKSRSSVSKTSQASQTTKASSQTTTETSEPVIGEKKPTITSEVAGLPVDYIGKWVNQSNHDFFEISKHQLTSGSDIAATTSAIVKVGQDQEGYLVQTADGHSYFLTVKGGKLYPTTNAADLASDFAKQITFDKE
jgi:hypothetical protein